MQFVAIVLVRGGKVKKSGARLYLGVTSGGRGVGERSLPTHRTLSMLKHCQSLTAHGTPLCLSLYCTRHSTLGQSRRAHRTLIRWSELASKQREARLGNAFGIWKLAYREKALPKRWRQSVAAMEDVVVGHGFGGGDGGEDYM